MDKRAEKKPRVLAVTSIFPNPKEITKGIYIFKQLEALSKQCPITVVAPVPYFPRMIRHQIYSKFNEIPQAETFGSMLVLHPRYLIFPKVGRAVYGFFYYLSLRRIIQDLAKSFRPDLCLGYWAYPDGFATVLLARTIGLPAVISCRGCDVNNLVKDSVRARYVRWALNKSLKVFAVSRAMSETIHELGVARDKITVIPNGVDASAFLRQDRQEARKAMGLDNFGGKDRIVLFCGRLSEEKDPMSLVLAIRVLADQNKGVKTIFVGDGPLKFALEEEVKRLSLGHVISFLGEVVHDRIPALMNACDLLCLPSLREGWPNTLTEALACGLPAVASDVGGVPEIITSDELGTIVPANNPERLAKALWGAVNRTWNRDRIQALFGERTWDVTASEILSAISESMPLE